MLGGLRCIKSYMVPIPSKKFGANNDCFTNLLKLHDFDRKHVSSLKERVCLMAVFLQSSFFRVELIHILPILVLAILFLVIYQRVNLNWGI